jgi:iron complex transport system ATP-binding protein
MAGIRIEARGLGRRAMDGTWLWRRADLVVHAGQAVGVLGRNGSGKTTMLRTLLGLLRPDEGKVYAAKGTGYVPQSSQLALPFAVRDVVAMGRVRHARLFGGLGRADMRAVDRALDRVGIADLAARSFLELSGGERQLVLIARALAADCQALILDEPFASLDLDNQRRILALLESLARAHELGIMFSSHHPDHVFAIADAVAVLRRGEAPVCGPVSQILTEKLLGQTYGVPVEVLQLPQSGSSRRHAVPILY